MEGKKIRESVRNMTMYANGFVFNDGLFQKKKKKIAEWLCDSVFFLNMYAEY